jgi:hypothetical protein
LKLSDLAKCAYAIAFFGAMPVDTGAMEIYGSEPIIHMDNGMVVDVVRRGGGGGGGHRGGGGHHVGGGHHGGHYGGGHHGGGGGVNRPAHPINRPGIAHPSHPIAGWNRPYRWRPGGAIAAGAAIGFLGAAAVTWATPPYAGLCWYYTDETRRHGFWDYCP